MAIAVMIRHTWRRAVAVAGAALVASALASCSTAPSAAGNADRVPSAAKAFSTGLGEAQEKVLFEAQNLLVQKCMERAGYRYTLPPFIPAPALPAAAVTDPLYVNQRELRSHGYGISRNATSAAASSNGQPGPPGDPNAPYVQSLSSQQRQHYQEASFGAKSLTVTLPDGKRISFTPRGCLGKAETELYGSAIQYNIVSIYDADIFDKVRNDALWSAAWKSAEAVWANCMAARGYHYANELAARVDVMSRYAASGARPAGVHGYEMRVARHDAACSAVAKMNSVSSAALETAAAGLTADQASVALEWNQMQAHALSVASGILGHG